MWPSRPGPGRSGEVDGLPLRLLPKRHSCQPSAWRTSRASTALLKLGAHPPPVASKRVQASAKAGERLWSSGNASAHAAQYAAGAVRIAERKPRPPRAAGKVATCLHVSDVCFSYAAEAKLQRLPYRRIMCVRIRRNGLRGHGAQRVVGSR